MGANRIFLDLKFHDIPNSVALAVEEAADRGVWMMTVHSSGGPAMLCAAAEAADRVPSEARPIIVGVSVLTSIDEATLQRDLGVSRSLEDHAVSLSKMAVEQGLDGVVCSPQEVSAIRSALGHSAVIVTPGIRMVSGEVHDQKRVATASQALSDGASYLVVGRALTDAPDPVVALHALGLDG
jgi:orotidine-5'-phosphate decarboxylase